MFGVRTRRLAAVVVLVLPACSGGGGVADDAPTVTSSPRLQSVGETATPTPIGSPSPTATPSPSAVGEAEITVDWAVPFSVTAPADWGPGEATTATATEIVDGTGLRSVLSAFLKSPDTPDDWVERLTTSDAIDATEPERVEIGGAQGHVFDARLTDAAPECAAGGSVLAGSCYVLHGPDDGWVWGIEEGRPARIWVLDVDGETVLMVSDARDDRFEEWVPTIEQVVSSITWGQP